MSRKIIEKLQYLKLPGIKEIYKESIQQAEATSEGYESFLLGLLEYECEIRINNRVAKLLRESGLPLGKTFTDFQLNRLSLRTRQKVKAIEDGSFLDRKENLLVFGKPGSGKTHLIAAIAHKLIEQNRRLLFTTCSILVQQLLIAKRDLKLPIFLKRLRKFDGLIIDDIGYVQQTRDEMEVLFTLLADRYESGSILLTSNLPFSKWENIFKDPMTAAAAVDRLVHHSIIIEMNNESYRSQEAKKRIEGEKENR